MNKKRILIISIIILLILLVLGGFFIFKVMNKKKTTSKNNKYKVVLVTDDKKEEKEVKENETLKLEKKEKEGYVFKGWEDEDKKLYTDEVKISKNLKLKAVFEKKEDQTTQPQTSEEEKKPEASDNNQNNNNTSKKYYCDKGYTLRGTNCIKTEKVNATSSARCPAGFTEEAGKCIHIMNAGPNCAGLRPIGEWKLQGDGRCHHPNGEDDEPQYNACQSGYGIVRVGPVEKCKKIIDKVVSYHCPSGYTLSGTSCFKTITIRAKVK